MGHPGLDAVNGACGHGARAWRLRHIFLHQFCGRGSDAWPFISGVPRALLSAPDDVLSGQCALESYLL